jgi:hypothetical protein
MTYTGTGDALTVYDSEGDVRVKISVDADGGAITLYESSATRLPGEANQGGRKVEFREGGVLLYGASDADTVCHLLPNGDIIGKGKIAIGTNQTNDGDWSNVIGFDNSADGDSATVSGGYNNDAAGAASVIGGGSNNSASGHTSTISGGHGNTASNLYAAVGGGSANTAAGSESFVGGGIGNIALLQCSTVGGGYYQTADGYWATVCGGHRNAATADRSFVGGGDGNKASGEKASVAGGFNNTASGAISTVGGGSDNVASGYGATIAGGLTATASSYSFVGGGMSNTADGSFSIVDGGLNNIASGYASTVGGGVGNAASGDRSAVSGGEWNTAGGLRSTVGGGVSNVAAGNYSAVPGGHSNHADSMYTFAAGRRARAIHDGAFVWADHTNADFSSERADQFRVRADGGARFDDGSQWVNIYDDGTDLITTSTGAHLTLGGTWTNSSSREAKEDFAAIDIPELLVKLAALPIQTWNYKGTNERHIGPVAEDFYELFGLGTDSKTISTIDPAGIALAAIQGLYQQNTELKQENEAIRAELAEVLARLEAVENK